MIGVQQRRVQSIQPHQRQAIDVSQSHTRRGLTPKDHQLLAQNEILGLKSRSPCESRLDSKQQSSQKCDHRPLPLPYGHARVIPDKVFGRHTDITITTAEKPPHAVP